MGEQKRYPKEFQLRAARLVVEQGYSQREVSERLGASTWSIGEWIKKFRASGELGGAGDANAGNAGASVDNAIAPATPHAQGCHPRLYSCAPPGLCRRATAPEIGEP